MPSRTFTIDELETLMVRLRNDLMESVDSGRWSEYFDVVFTADDDKQYYVSIAEGLTEIQMDGMSKEDHYPDHVYVGGEYVVQCPEVELYREMVPVTKWRKVA